MVVSGFSPLSTLLLKQMKYTKLIDAIKQAKRVETTIATGGSPAYFNAKITKQDALECLKHYLENEDIAGMGVWYNEQDEIMAQAFGPENETLSIGI